MSPQWTRVPVPLVLVLVLVLVLSGPARTARSDRNMVSEEYVGATVNATVLDARGNPVHMMSSDDGTYGQDSPKVDTRSARVIAPATHHGVVDRQGCDPATRFLVPPRSGHWVALLQRGNCTFKEKILKAAAYNATAVLIYNNSTDKTVRMGHEGTGDTVAVMITEAYGREILAQLERNLTVLVSVVVGQRGPTKNINRGSLVFVSISFIVLMVISSAWLVFYFIQKIRYSSARDRSQRRLGDAAKKAIGKLTTRTVKKGDKETDPDFNHCAVCIEAYQLNDVVRILPCKHVFHKVCVDPWLNEHCTCPMCKLNILKALGIMVSLHQSQGSVKAYSRSRPLGANSCCVSVPRPASPVWTAWCWTWSAWASARRPAARGRRLATAASRPSAWSRSAPPTPRPRPELLLTSPSP
uniref:Ring finger protein 130 n=1 Tax=Sander lucioperca TaxID=283035 RepID=A0A8D0A852_SANLU